jgi:hypothetical protein
MTWRIVEPGTTTTILDRTGGLLFCASCRVGTYLSMTVNAWQPGGPNTTRWLHEAVGRALGDMGVTATVEPQPHSPRKA